MPEEQRVFPNPENITYIPELIEKLGGVDIAFGGIGINGHVAFNEANPAMTNEEFLAQKTRVLEISPETRTANAIGDFGGALEDMPHYCVTIGIYEISHARKIRLSPQLAQSSCTPRRTWGANCRVPSIPAPEPSRHYLDVYRLCRALED